MGTCVTCPVYYRDTTPRPATIGLVCGSCRERLAWHLADLPGLYARLDATPVTAPGGGRVSGSREPALGVRLLALNLMSPASPHDGPVTDPGDYQTPSDRTAEMPTATVLRLWTDLWIDARGQGEHPPRRTVPAMSEWLGNRLDDIVTREPVADFAGEVRTVVATLRAVNGDVDAKPEHKAGVECPRCDRVTLYDVPWDGTVECLEDRAGCGSRLRYAEYHQWLAIRDHWIRMATPCQVCGEGALQAASSRAPVECLTMRGGCGQVWSRREYEVWAAAVHRGEVAA